MFKFIQIPFGYVLEFFYGFFHNYGIALILFSLAVKVILLPLSMKQKKSMMKTSRLQPKVKQIELACGADKQKYPQEVNKLYKDEGVSMYGGCLPMIVQMFIIMGLFALLRTPMSYLDTNMLFAIHEPFLWIKDLAQPDKWILPISAGAATFFSFSMNSSMASMGGGNAQQTAMMSKIMKYFFPLFSLWICSSYNAIFALYWVVSNVFAWVQGLVMNKMFEKMDENQLETAGEGTLK